MLSALKKWAKGGNEDAKGSMPSGVRAMGQALQRKFARGIQFNMKIVIKGDRNTGKSCLFQRLQGKSFNEQYIPTNEIQVASIHWNYRTTDDVVKVEVWDVVDKGRSKKPLRDSLKLENDKTEGEKDGNVLDAEFVDVFKGAHGVMMIMDITKPWTFQYIERELPKVPPHLPVLVLASHRDMGEHRLVQTEEVIAFIENLERPDRSPPVHYAEASMKNSFGLKYIHKFLNLPFLLLQRETLLKQLQVNSEDMESTLEELQIHKESEEQDYEKFVSILERKKKEHEAKKAAVAAAAAAAAAGEDQPTTPPGSPSDNPSTDNTVKTPSSTPSSQGSSFKSRISRVAAALSPTEKETSEEVIPRSSSELSPADIDEFVPEDELDAGFLDENGAGGKKRPSKPAVKKPVAQVPFEQDKSDESDSDTDSRNPMVAGFVEDIDSEDDSVPPVVTNHINKVMNNGADHRKKPAKPVTPVTVELTSSEEEEQEQEENEEDEELKKRDQRDKEKDKASKAKQRDSAPLKLEMPVKSVPVSDAAVEDVGLGIETVDDWLNSPDSEPKIPFSTSSDSKNYTVRKVDVNSPPAKSAPIPLDEWDKFMTLQLQPQTRGATTPSGALIDMDEDEDNEQETNGESKSRKKQEHKSGEKSRTKHKHRKHKDKSTEGGEEGEKSKDKERRRSRHKEGSEKEKERRKSKDEESDKKKKQKRRHSRAKSEEEFQEGVTYEEL